MSEMSEEKSRIEVVCPHCHAQLKVDPRTGLVVRSEHPRTTFSLEEAVQKEKSRRDKSDELFAQAFSDEKRRQESLEEKFKEALRSKDELEEPGPRPLDLD